MSIGEPKHAPPAFVVDTLRAALNKLGSYPATAGLPETRAACAAWLERRFGLGRRVNPETMVLPVNGTREALFSFVQAVVSQRHESGARGGDAESVLPDLRGRGPARRRRARVPQHDGGQSLPARPRCRCPPETWKRCEVLFLCSPGNPTGSVLSLDYLRQALELAERSRFRDCVRRVLRRVVSRRSAPPPSLLQAALALRPRFVSSAASCSTPCRSARACRACAPVSLPAIRRSSSPSALPHVSRLRDAGSDAARQHRGLERRRARGGEPRAVPGEIRARAADPRSPCSTSWSRTAPSTCGPTCGRDDETFTRELFAAQNLTILPGSYLARDTRGRQSRQASCAHLARRFRRGMRDRRAAHPRLSWRTHK